MTDVRPDPLDSSRLSRTSSNKRKKPHRAVIAKLEKFIDSPNIAEDLSETLLMNLGQKVVEEYELDERTRDEWREKAEKAMKSALQEDQPKNWPFQNSSNVKWPLVTTAALQFNARAYPALVDNDGPVKGRVVGSDKGIPQIDQQTGQQAIQVLDDGQGNQIPVPLWQQEPGAKQAQADRISEHMSWQLLEEMEEWEEDTDTLLMQLPIIGCVFRKVYHDETTGRNRSDVCSPFDVVVNQKAKSLSDTPRITHIIELYPHQVEERIRAELYSEIDVGLQQDADGDESAPHEFLEQHRMMDLDEDGLEEPYIVTVHKETSQVMRIVANYDLESIRENERGNRIISIKRRDFFVKYAFIPDPEGGFYDLGFGHLLQSLAASIDTTVNQILDAATLQNAGGGFIGSGLRLPKSLIRREPGLWQPVSAAGGVIRDAMVPHQDPGPSPVLFNLLGFLIEAARDITATKDILTGDTGGRNIQATTALALIEQGLKVFTAIYKRVFRSFKKEFQLLFDLNSRHLPEQVYFNVLDDPKAVARSDYDAEQFNVIPQADPRIVTDMQRLARAQVLLETQPINTQATQVILRRYYEAAGIEDVDELLPPQQASPDQVMALEQMDREISKTEAETQKLKSETVKNLGAVEEQEQRLAFDVATEEDRQEMEEERLEREAQQTNGEAA